MNVFIVILLLFALLGAVDKIIGGKLGVAEEFDRGLASMGPLCLSISGIYCIAVTALSAHPEAIAGLSAVLPFDPSLIAGALLAPDMGGYAIATQLAASQPLALYSGLMVSSTLGCLISFVLPISLGGLPSYEVSGFMQGVLWGIIALPVALAAGGLLLGLPLPILVSNTWPVLLLCAALCLALRLVPRGCIRVLSGLGQLVRIAGILLFCVVTLGVFVPAWSVADSALFQEVLVIVFKIAVTLCGSTVACGLLLSHCGGAIDAAAEKLGVNRYAAVGLFVSLATSVSMIPLYSRMDARGKILNAAFAVSGAFVFGGQLAFVSSVESGSVGAYMACKLAGGIAALLLAGAFTKNEKPAASGI
ncbi:ethanolamine utilization protein EutH [Clostridium sp. D33t1_170424_F3]|uniref:ethanolamine utilization protein EutH n=1 Tax=Clostridium sp. D33t1_170424_F3 TaxID=2787099 RepID=UPI0018AB582A|nr:ethanolamine utilization protein EutH [Clostridium sp. D33t1_170424_F3]